MTLSYQQILQTINYPTDILVLDFETYYDKDYSLSKMSTIEYIMDTRFEVTGLGERGIIKNGGGTTDAVLFLSPEETETFLDLINWDFITVIVKNTKFDITILKEKYGVVPKYIIDIEDLSRHWDSRMKHSLKNLTKLFKLPAKGETKQFLGLHYKDMVLGQKTALSEYCLGDINNTFELFKILLPYLTNAQVELKLARHTLDLYLNPKIKFDRRKADELAELMKNKIDLVCIKTGYSLKELSGNISFVKLLNATLPEGELIPVKLGKNKSIPALAKDDEGLHYLLNHSKEEVRTLVEARQAVKSWPLHIKRVENLNKQAAVNGGYLRIPLKYYGGHTGRWSGTGGINPQNFGATGRAGRGIHELISKIRELLLAPDNYKFIIIDSAQIEARILAWLAGQEDLLNGFKDGEDIYSRFASLLFDTEIRKPVETDNDTDRNILIVRRGFGKDAILGCGYGMGSKKFYERCLQNIDLRPLFDSKKYDFAFIDNLVKTYRTTYKRIPEFWTLVEKCFKHVVKFKNEDIIISSNKDYRGIELYITPADKPPPFSTKFLLAFSNRNDTVNLQLPSGRILYYRHCRINNDNEICWHYGNLWGGSITENIVQAIARDLLGYWILEFEKRSLPVVLHTHDEIVSLVPEDRAVSALGLCLAESLMNHGPDWAKGLPLASEGVISGVYKK